MSLASNISDLATRIATEFKAVRILISGSGNGDTSGLDTTATNLVEAINEVLAGSSGAPPSASDTVAGVVELATSAERSEEHTSELQSLMRISYAVFCLIKKKKNNRTK